MVERASFESQQFTKRTRLPTDDPALSIWHIVGTLLGWPAKLADGRPEASRLTSLVTNYHKKTYGDAWIMAVVVRELP